MESLHKENKVIRIGRAPGVPETQPYASFICYADWADEHLHLMHQHEDMAEILIFVQGKGQYMLGGVWYPVQAGDIALCSYGMVHDEIPQMGERYCTYCLGISGLHLPGLPQGALIPPGQVPVFHQPPQFGELYALASMIEHHAAMHIAGYQSFCHHLTCAILALIPQMAAQNLPAAQDTLCVRVKRYIDQHYAEELTLERLGQEFYISPYHLAHIFKQQTGYTVKQYILRRRIGQAQSRLVDTSDSISKIAADMGFTDAAYFTRLFTRHIGMPPGGYRILRKGKGQDS